MIASVTDIANAKLFMYARDSCRNFVYKLVESVKIYIIARSTSILWYMLVADPTVSSDGQFERSLSDMGNSEQ